MVTTPRRTAHPGRRVLLAIVLLVPLLILILAAAGEMTGWPFLRGPVESFMAQRLQSPVRIAAPFRVHFLGSLRARAGGLWIAAPAGFDAPHLVDAGDLGLTLRYRDLLALREGQRLRIAAIDVGRIDAHLLRRDDGSATWQLGPPRTGEAAPPPVIESLGVREGALAVDDALTPTTLKVVFSTAEGSLQTAPTGRAKVRGQLRGRPIDGELDTAGFLRLAATGKDVRPVAAKARIDYGGVHAEFDGTVTDLLGARDLAGTFSARGPSLGVLGELVHAVLPTSGAFSLRGRLEKHGELWRAQVDSATVGRSALNGRFTYDARAATPRLDGELGGTRFFLADLAPAFGTRNPDGSEVKPPPGRVLPDRKLDLPTLHNMDARIAVDVQHVDLGSAFSQPIAPLRAMLNLDGGRLALSGIDARTAQGRLSGEIAVDAARNVPQWAANLGWDGIRLEDWIGAAKARKAEAAGQAPPPPFFTGMLRGRARVTGHGRSTAELLGSLDGEITTAVRGGSVSHLVVEVLGLDVAQGLGVWLGGDKPVRVDCAVVDFAARDGRLTPQVALIDTPVTLVLVDGHIGLGDERLDLRFTAKPKNVSPFTLRSPIRVGGTFATPQAGPEAGPLAGKAMAGLALSFVNPLAAIIPFVDPGESVTSPCRQAMAALQG